jgi:hypothetical protein
MLEKVFVFGSKLRMAHRWIRLKPFGFAIHWAVEQYSRSTLYLEVATSNNDPQVVAKCYLDTITSLCGIVQTIMSDRGTYNVTVTDKDITWTMQRRELMSPLCWFNVKFTI